jgi:hypothetical protein
MSQERRERQKERLGIQTAASRKWRRNAIYAVAIVAAFGLAYYLVNRMQHKHDAFARCLNERGVKMYGAFWCPHCVEQKEKFGASFEYALYVECGVKGKAREETQACKDEGIKQFPTWQFPPAGERVSRVFSLEELSDRTGCSLP